MSTLIKEDCLSGIKKLPDSSLNLTITSPPYNLGATAYKNPITYNSYSDSREHNDYIMWLTEIFASIKEKTVTGGRLAINIGDQKNGAIPTHVHLSDALAHVGWKPMATIIWNKNQTRNRAAWGSWNSPSCPSFPCPFEYILLFYKGEKKLQHGGITDLVPDEFKQFAYGVWEVGPSKNKVHPAVFPSAIPYRLMKMLSYPGDKILDPFAGVGTTLIIADALKRLAVGFEIDEVYIKEYHRIRSALRSHHHDDA